VKVRQHGTRARYVFGESGGDTRNGCRCFECSAAAVLYEKRRVAARRRGEAPFVAADEARAHLLWLRQNGIGRRTIEAQTGLSNSTVSKIAKGTVTRIRPSTAERILAVHLGKAPGGAAMDATRTLTQIDDLIRVVGMTKTEIARELGAKTRALQIAKNGRVTKVNADKVDALWRHHMTPVLARRENDRDRRAHYRSLEREKAS
jgi:DNA-binding Xre family transcriptional regulator